MDIKSDLWVEEEEFWRILGEVKNNSLNWHTILPHRTTIYDMVWYTTGFYADEGGMPNSLLITQNKKKVQEKRIVAVCGILRIKILENHLY